MADTRKCRTCGQVRHLKEMRRGPGSAWLCVGCEPPAPRLCLLCDKKAGCRAGLCHTHGERWRRWGKPPVEEWVAAFREHRLNTCAICGQTWNGYRGSRTCSEACDRERRRREELARWHAKPPAEKRRASLRSQERDRARRQESLIDIACAICGTVFRGFPHRKFCSSECQERDTNERRKEIRQRVDRLRLARVQQELEAKRE
jgi:endogenous inhibitor of DNA gyrase (YacG/DUF329 family)